MIIDFLVCTWSVKEAPTFLSRHLGGQMPEAEILICTVQSLDLIIRIRFFLSDDFCSILINSSAVETFIVC